MISASKCLHLLILLTLGLTLRVSAQQQYNESNQFLNANKIWIFPDSAGIEFGSTPQGVLSSNYYGTSGMGEGASSVCNPLNGDLLFYSNGRKCWNASGTVMPNGDSLLGNNVASTVQGTVIIPFINDSTKFYLFSLAEQAGIIQDGDSKGSLFYSVIDMTMDSGNGDIDSTMKNIPIDTIPLSEAMIAIPGYNCDIWLLVHEAFTAKYRAFRITAEGIETVPVISTTNGAVMPYMPQLGPPYDQNAYIQGSLAVSPNREYIAMNTSYFAVFGGLTLAKFDANTGEVSDEIQIGAADITSGSSVTFSPDNSKLYTYEYNNFALNQYDISTFDSTVINASKFSVTGVADLTYLRLYNDTIYAATKGLPYISAITSPNSAGAACAFELNAIQLANGTYNTGTLPTEVVNGIADTLTQTLLDTLICAGYSDGIPLTPANIEAVNTNYVWSSGESDSILTVYTAGMYWVRYQAGGCTMHVDTFILRGADLVVPQIRINVGELSTVQPYDTYQWLLNGSVINNATNPTYVVTENGDYQVIVSNDAGCIDTSEVYEVRNVKINPAQTFNKKVKIYPNPTEDIVYINSPLKVTVEIADMAGRIIKRTNNSRAISVGEMSPGIYLMRIYHNSKLLKTEKLFKKNN